MLGKADSFPSWFRLLSNTFQAFLLSVLTMSALHCNFQWRVPLHSTVLLEAWKNQRSQQSCAQQTMDFESKLSDLGLQTIHAEVRRTKCQHIATLLSLYQVLESILRSSLHSMVMRRTTAFLPACLAGYSCCVLELNSQSCMILCKSTCKWVLTVQSCKAAYLHGLRLQMTAICYNDTNNDLKQNWLNEQLIFLASTALLTCGLLQI